MYKPYRLYFCSIQFTICDRVWPLQENWQYFVTIYLINGIAGSWKTPELFLFWSTKAMDFVSSSWVKLNSINVCLRNIKHVPCFYGVIETWKFGRTRNAVGTRVLKLDRKHRKQWMMFSISFRKFCDEKGKQLNYDHQSGHLWLHHHVNSFCYSVLCSFFITLQKHNLKPISACILGLFSKNSLSAENREHFTESFKMASYMYLPHPIWTPL